MHNVAHMMTHDLLLALVAFAFATSITPGPNNLMLMASGANFGVRRTVPHLLGVSLGFVLLALGVGLGAASLFEIFPLARTALTIAGAAYLLHLAWRIANAVPAAPGMAAGRPMSFLEAAAFQWVNPKAWGMALTAVTVYAPDNGPAATALVALIFGAVNLPAVATWAWIGGRLSGFLAEPARRRLFNGLMAGLLVLSLYPILALGASPPPPGP